MLRALNMKPHNSNRNTLVARFQIQLVRVETMGHAKWSIITRFLIRLSMIRGHKLTHV